MCKSAIILEQEHIMGNKGIDKFSEPLINAIKCIVIKPKRQNFKIFEDHSNKATMDS